MVSPRRPWTYRPWNLWTDLFPASKENDVPVLVKRATFFGCFDPSGFNRPGHFRNANPLGYRNFGDQPVTKVGKPRDFLSPNGRTAGFCSSP